MTEAGRRGIRAAQGAILVNACLAIVKLVAGIVGHSSALVADAVESTFDIFSSTIVWSGLRIAGRDPDTEYPFGYGNAEPLAGAVVSLMLLGAAVAVAVDAIEQLQRPDRSPAAWTLAVLAAVVIVKWLLSRRVHAVGADIGSVAVKADASHHMSDAVTSLAAFVGISIAVVGGERWAAADEWAALFASAIIAYNSITMARPALHDLMDRTPGPEILEPVRRAAESVPGVLATEKIAVRRSGIGYRVTLHVQASPDLSLHDAHVLGGRVKGAIRSAVPSVQYVLVHMEPFTQGPV